MIKPKIELLAPAGDFERLEMALHYGADAEIIEPAVLREQARSLLSLALSQYDCSRHGLRIQIHASSVGVAHGRKVAAYRIRRRKHDFDKRYGRDRRQCDRSAIWIISVCGI